MAGAYRDKGMYHSIRCSKDNPQHVNVNRVLSDLNTDIYKSKNQFLIDAVDYYIKMLNEEDLTNTAAMENAKNQRILRVKDIEALKQNIIDEVMIGVQREVIAILAQAVANRTDTVRQEPVANRLPIVTEPEPSTEKAVNPIVAQMASFWGTTEEEMEE